MVATMTEKHIDLQPSLAAEKDKKSSWEIRRILTPSDADLQLLQEHDNNPETRANDFYDYSTVVVRKPWGYEYLMFQNSSVAVWILYIKYGDQTSLHCHPTKKTSLIVLSGKAECSLIDSSELLYPGQGLLIGKGIFHRTRAVSDDGIYVMEIESPVNKRDLVRCLDDYGRENQGYESDEHFSLNTSNFNYVSLIESGIYYNVKKRFGNCSIELAEFPNISSLQELLVQPDWNVLAIQKGEILNSQGEVLFESGDSVSREDILSITNLALLSAFEAIIVRQLDTKNRLSDFIVSSLKGHGVHHVFFVSKPINAHLTDALGRDTEMVSVGMRTEMGAALAGEGFSKLTGKPGVVFISSGDSGINALSGVANSFVDSTPLLVISGQSRPSKLGLPGTNDLRQLANKEIDIAKIAIHLTCYAKTISDPKEIMRELEIIFKAMVSSRPTPAWLDIPIDILGMTVDEQEMLPPSAPMEKSISAVTLGNETIAQLAHMLKNASRPVILAGQGIRLSGAEDLLMAVATKNQIPVLTSRRGIDLLEDNFPFFFGRPGTYGHRSANFIIQNCDLLISIGCRLSFPLIGRNYQAFARGAKKIIVDIDQAELCKPTIHPDLAINCSASVFLSELLRHEFSQHPSCIASWRKRCVYWRTSFPPEKEGYEDSRNGINPYLFIYHFSQLLPASSTVVVDGGTSLDYVMQTFRVKPGTRIVSSPGLEQLGFALPASIGACVGQTGKRVFCICERKGLQLCAAELETIAVNKLPIVILLLNSSGDIGTKRVQSDYFGNRFVGATNQGITSYLNTQALGALYNIPVHSVTCSEELSPNLERIVGSREPALFDIRLPEQVELKPRLLFSVTSDGQWIAKPLEDMYPFLSREELQKNMLIPLLDE